MGPERKSGKEPADTGKETLSDQSEELVLWRYIERINAGERIRPAEVYADHPEMAREILDQLDAFQGIETEFRASGSLSTLGDYTLRRQIGRGGMGVVYEAWQGSLDRQVALKVLPAGIAADNKSFVRFMREAKTAAQLSHQNIVGVHGMGVESNTPYYSMEYVEGETLAQILITLKEAETETDTPFGRKDDVAYFGNLARAFGDVADGLQHAHSRGVVHRDIKPSNLILDAEERPRAGAASTGESLKPERSGHRSPRLRILDFGLARLEGQESLTLSGDLMGTVLYMSPEQAMAKRIPLDHRTDIYSLGATLYEALTGEPPFRGKDQHDTLSQIIVRDPRPPRQLNPRIPKDLETIVLKCLRKDPHHRYGTAEALAQDLRRFVRGDPIEARSQSRIEKLLRSAASNRRKILVGTCGLLMALVCGVLGYRLSVERRQKIERDYEQRVRGAVMKLLTGETSSTSVLARDLRVTRAGLGLPPDFEDVLPEGRRTPLEEAVMELTLAVRDLPGRVEAYFYRARALSLLGRDAEALDDLDEALELNREFAPARSGSLARRSRVTAGRSTSTRTGLVARERMTSTWRRARGPTMTSGSRSPSGMW